MKIDEFANLFRELIKSKNIEMEEMKEDDAYRFRDFIQLTDEIKLVFAVNIYLEEVSITTGNNINFEPHHRKALLSKINELNLKHYTKFYITDENRIWSECNIVTRHGFNAQNIFDHLSRDLSAFESEYKSLINILYD